MQNLQWRNTLLFSSTNNRLRARSSQTPSHKFTRPKSQRLHLWRTQLKTTSGYFPYVSKIHDISLQAQVSSWNRNPLRHFVEHNPGNTQLHSLDWIPMVEEKEREREWWVWWEVEHIWRWSWVWVSWRFVVLLSFSGSDVRPFPILGVWVDQRSLLRIFCDKRWNESRQMESKSWLLNAITIKSFIGFSFFSFFLFRSFSLSLAQ